MAEQEINLLPESEYGGSKVQRRTRFVSTFTIVLLVVTLVVLGAMFLLWASSDRQLTKLRDAKRPIETEVKDLSDKEGLIRVISQKVDAVQNVIKSQPKFKDIVTNLLARQTTGIAYTELTLTAPNKVLISGRAGSLDNLETFFADLTAKEYGRKVFSDIVLQSLIRNDKGEFEFSLRFNYTTQ